MDNTDIIIIGAGASGLAAARELTNAGSKVILLEARERAGGRIHTLDDGTFSKPVELGAEFVHGHLPITLGLLRQYHIPYHATGGEMWQMHDGKFKQGYDSFEHGDLLHKRLRELQEDISVKEFLETNFSGPEYSVLRNSARGFVEGYDAADYARASAFKFRDEWLEEEEWEQYRIEGGYAKLIEAMANECRSKGALIYFSTVVKEIKWRKNYVEVITNHNRSYRGCKVLLTVPLGILQAKTGSEGAISFTPAIDEKLAAANSLGFGSVDKVIMQFSKAFWDKDLGFLLSDAPIPTWWTQLPDNAFILTGWLAGGLISPFKTKSKEEILQLALNSLAYIFNQSETDLKSWLQAWQVIQWANETFSKGAYAYETVNSNMHRKILGQPVEETIFFAGEALYDGPSTGTVEAALASGIAAAKQILQ